MKKRELINIGIPSGEPVRLAIELLRHAPAGKSEKRAMREALKNVADRPRDYLNDPTFEPLARVLVDTAAAQATYEHRTRPAAYRQWGRDLDAMSVRQMENACRLPVAIRGALMPDAHVGYGLPIGGVLAAEAAVIPYAVGVDIACRMKMTVLDLPVDHLKRRRDQLTDAIHVETRFGVGAAFKQRRRHDVMDLDWSVSSVTRAYKDRAWAQLGTSGSGNHFVEFGILSIDREDLDLPPGSYLALLSHSGSRGTGAAVCSHYSKLARRQHRELPTELSQLAWLDLDTEAGAEYWAAMELMGHYAAANHACIHRHIARHLGTRALLDLENHHNFAGKEDHDGHQVIVHRKGATPAADGVLGIIPGTMASPAYVVRGLGNPESLDSAAHGAGRVMSRKQAKSTLDWKEARMLLAERGVTLLSAGLDEVPMVYKNIDEVMEAQQDLVHPVARFDPKLVKMAPAGEWPED